MTITIARQQKASKIKLAGDNDNQYEHIHIVANAAMKQRATKFSELLTQLSNFIPSDMLKTEIPLATYNKKNPDTIFVFPNIPMDMMRCLRNRSTLYNYCKLIQGPGTWIMSPFHKLVMADLADKKGRAAKWNSAPRAFKTINKKQSMSIERWMRSVMRDDCISYIPDSSIRDYCGYIIGNLKPAELLIVETPEQFMAMYERGPQSCMKSSTEGAVVWRKIMAEVKLHPTSFYAFCPEIIGACLQNDKIVLARTLLYKVKGEVKYYGRIFSSTPDNTRKLELALLKKFPKILRQLRDDEFALQERFEIPIVEWGKGKYIGLPYTDNITLNLFFKPMPEKGKCIVAPSQTLSAEEKKTFASFDTRHASGFYPISAFQRVDCSTCGRQLMGARAIRFGDDLAWCSDQCMKKAGFVRARNATGQEIIRPKDLCVADAYYGYYYTTRNAASKNGCGPYIQTLTDLLKAPDELPLSAFKVGTLAFNGSRYNMASSILACGYTKRLGGGHVTKDGLLELRPYGRHDWQLTDLVDLSTMTLKKNADPKNLFTQFAQPEKGPDVIEAVPPSEVWIIDDASDINALFNRYVNNAVQAQAPGVPQPDHPLAQYVDEAYNLEGLARNG